MSAAASSTWQAGVQCRSLNRGAKVRRGAVRDGATVVGGVVGIRRGERSRVHGQAERFGADLGQRGVRAGADLQATRGTGGRSRPR